MADPDAPDPFEPAAFTTAKLPDAFDLLAPDGSEVRVLAGVARGGMAHFRLPAGETSRAVQHRTVAEIWYILQGQGEIWRSANGREQITALSPGVCLTIEAGTAFQFRAFAEEALAILGVTMPPWPGSTEAITADGKWPATV